MLIIQITTFIFDYEEHSEWTSDMSTVEKLLSVRFLKMYTFIQQGCITLIKSDRKIIIYKNLQLQKKYIFISESWKKVSWFYKKNKQRKCLNMNNNVSSAQNQHIWIMTSSDTEYWRNGCWKFSFTMTEINKKILN